MLDMEGGSCSDWCMRQYSQRPAALARPARAISLGGVIAAFAQAIGTLWLATNARVSLSSTSASNSARFGLSQDPLSIAIHELLQPFVGFSWQPQDRSGIQPTPTVPKQLSHRGFSMQRRANISSATGPTRHYNDDQFGRPT